MENRVRIAMAANRKIVQDGLNRRKLEHQLDAFENTMICRCNEKYDTARIQRLADEAVNRDRMQSKARIAARAEAKAHADRLRKDIALACLIFFVFATVMFQLATWALLPVWAVLILVAFGALFLVSYIRNPDGFPIMEDDE